MSTLAVNEIATIVQSIAAAGVVAGTTVGVPTRTRLSDLLTVLTFSADPGNTSYFVEGSLDGTNWYAIVNLTGTDATPLSHQITNAGMTHIRCRQAAKVNAVSTRIWMRLV